MSEIVDFFKQKHKDLAILKSNQDTKNEIIAFMQEIRTKSEFVAELEDRFYLQDILDFWQVYILDNYSELIKIDLLTPSDSIQKASSFQFLSGTLSPNSPFYIEREADSICLGILRRTDSNTIVIKGSRQVGKSSLMQRMLSFEQNREKRIIFIDFQPLSESLFAKPTEFFQQFCRLLSDKLNLPDKVDQYWKKRDVDTIKYERYLRDYILAQSEQPLILALDEVDKLFNQPVSQDFFATLRAWHNKRAYETEFKKLTLFLSISTEPHLFIPNLSQSPFNVGITIHLDDFNTEAVQKLNELYLNPLNAAEIKDVTEFLGGHPYLTQQVLYYLASESRSWTELREQMLNDETLFNRYLHLHYQDIMKDEALKQAIKDVCEKQYLYRDTAFYRLQAAGLIKEEGSKVIFRNKLYAHCFTEKLNHA